MTDLANINRHLMYKCLNSPDPIRLDGRGLYDLRDLKITFHRNEQFIKETLFKEGQVQSDIFVFNSLNREFNNGVVDVSLGDTRVLSKCTAFIKEPYPERPQDGMITVNTEISGMSSAERSKSQLNNGKYTFLKGESKEICVEISRLVDRSLRGSKAFDTESLCIITGEKVWCIRVDITILIDDGNLLDCAHIAAVSALLNFKRPDVSVENGELIIHSVEERNPIGLGVHHIPVYISFGMTTTSESITIAGDEVIIVDPTKNEEMLCKGSLSISMNAHAEICSLQKGGGIPISIENVMLCNKMAVTKSKEIIEFIGKAVSDEEARRKKMSTPSYAGYMTKKIEKRTTVEEINEEANEKQEMDIEDEEPIKIVQKMKVFNTKEQKVSKVDEKTSKNGKIKPKKIDIDEMIEKEEKTTEIEEEMDEEEIEIPKLSTSKKSVIPDSKMFGEKIKKKKEEKKKNQTKATELDVAIVKKKKSDK